MNRFFKTFKLGIGLKMFGFLLLAIMVFDFLQVEEISSTTI